MAAFTLYPLNDLVLKAALKEVKDGSITPTPLTSGTVTAFISLAILPSSAAADVTLVGTCTHISNGNWRVFFDASILTYTLLNGLFAAATPYVIIQQSGGFRTYVTGAYAASRPATVPD